MGPFDDLIPGGRTAAPGVIMGPARQPAPQTQAQAQKDVLDVRAAQIDIARGPAEAEKLRADADRARAEADKARAESEGLNSKTKALDALSEQIDRVQDLYETGFKNQGLATPLELIPGLPGNQQFNVAGAGLSDQALAAFRVPGIGSQSDRELAAFVQANQPRAGDTDAAIEEKLSNVRRRVDAARQARGLPAWTWKGAALPAEREQQAPPIPAPAAPIDPNGTGDIGFNQEAQVQPLKPEQQQAYDAFWKANPNATAEELQAFAGAAKIPLANAAEIIAARDKGAGVQGGSSAIYAKPDISDVRGNDPSFVGGVVEDARAAGRGVLGSVGLDDELIALADTTQGGTLNENLHRERAIRDYDRENNGWSRMAGEIAGGVMIGMAIPGGTQARLAAEVAGRRAAFQALRGGATREAASAAAMRAAGAITARRSAVEGATLGAAYGAGNSDGNIADRLSGAVVGAGTGAGAGYLVGRAIPAVGAGMAERNMLNRAPTREQVELARAGVEENVPLSRPVVDPSARDRMMYLDTVVGTGDTVRNSLNATREGIEARAGQLGRGGTAQTEEGMGQRVQEAGQRFIDRSRGVGHRLYTRAAQMAGDTLVWAQQAVRTIDGQIAELSGNATTNAPLIRYLQDVRADFARPDGTLIPKTVAQIRDMRTSLRGQISERNLTMTDAERRVSRALDAAGADVRRDLGTNNSAAVQAYARADRFWRERQSEITQVVQRVIGRRDDRLSGGAVMSKLRGMAQGDAARLQRLYDKLDPQERVDLAATFAENVGRRAPDTDFSPALFISQTSKLSPDSRRIIFGADGARSIANLRSLSEAFKQTQGRLNNSRSGAAANWGAFWRNFTGGGSLGAGVGTAVGGLPGGIAGAAAGAGLSGVQAAQARLSARALMSPDMSRWLSLAPRQTTAGAVARHVGLLGNIAARNPAISGEVTGLQKALRSAVNDNLTPVARQAAASDPGQASDEQNDSGPPRPAGAR